MAYDLPVACGQHARSQVSFLSIQYYRTNQLTIPRDELMVSTNEWGEYWRLLVLVETQHVAVFHGHRHAISFRQSYIQPKNYTHERLTVKERSAGKER